MTNQLVPAATSVPLIFTARPESRTRMSDFFSSHIRNPNTRRAYMEAVRQFSAFVAASMLKDQGLIEYTRGVIHIPDLKRLEAKACECYHVIKDH